MNEDISHEKFARHVVATLPESLQERMTVLSTLLSVLPARFEHRHQIVKMIEGLRAHERAQMEFQGLLPKEAR